MLSTSMAIYVLRQPLRDFEISFFSLGLIRNCEKSNCRISVICADFCRKNVIQELMQSRAKRRIRSEKVGCFGVKCAEQSRN